VAGVVTQAIIGGSRFMAKVLLHCTNEPSLSWSISKIIEMQRIPCIGEYVQPDNSSDAYEVITVLHTTFAGAAQDAEVFAAKGDYSTKSIKLIDEHFK
jgi:hypothetical protein